MPSVTSREELKHYCLRRLGAPVLQINVADEQVEDRISDALDFFVEFHEESTSRIFHKHQITEEDYAAQYIRIPPVITHIHNLLPLTSSSNGGFGSLSIAHDPMYQMRHNDLVAFGSSTISGSLQYMHQVGSHLKMLQMQTSGTSQEFRFTKYANRLNIDVDWSTDIAIDDWIIIDAERLIIYEDDVSSPEEVESTLNGFWNNMFLKEYTTALIKQQWGMNLTKYSGMQMPGGVTFDGERILNEAREDIERIKIEARETWERPLGDVFMG